MNLLPRFYDGFRNLLLARSMGTILETNEPRKIYLADPIAPLPGTKYWWNWGLLISIGLGLLAAIVGLSFIIVSWFAQVGMPWSIPGALLLVVSIALFFFAAHCMDKVDEAGKAIRREYCRTHGLSY